MSTKYSPTLPVELWHNISSHLDQKDHLSLILVNRTFYAIFLSELFTTIVIALRPSVAFARFNFNDKSSNTVREKIRPIPTNLIDSRLSVLGEPICSLLEMLHSKPELRSYIRRCELRFLSFSSSPPSLSSAEQFDPVDYIISLVGDLPHLEEVTLHGVKILVRHVAYLCSRPHLALDLVFENSTIIGRLELQDATNFTVNYLKFLNSFIYPTNNPTLSAIVAGGSLRELILTEPSGVIQAFLKFHAAQGNASLPRLQILELAWLNAQYFGFFESTPNLIELRLIGPHHINLVEEPLPEGTLPKLQSISVHSSFLRIFVPSRPVKVINTGEDKSFLHPSQTLRLTWTNYTRGKELFQYIVEYNTQLVHLEVVMAKEVYECARLLKGLEQLRTLYLKASTRPPALQALWNRDWGNNTWFPSGGGQIKLAVRQLDALK
ncbi:15222_t:CDS:2, partial [Acaulospora colombiana]